MKNIASENPGMRPLTRFGLGALMTSTARPAPALAGSPNVKSSTVPSLRLSRMSAENAKFPDLQAKLVWLEKLDVATSCPSYCRKSAHVA